jgi:hypothetical protein
LGLTEGSGTAVTSNVPLLRAFGQGFELPYSPGLRWWLTPAAPVGTAVLYDPAELVGVIRREMDVAIDPFFGFQKGEVGLRVYARADVVVGQSASAVTIDLTP